MGGLTILTWNALDNMWNGAKGFEGACAFCGCGDSSNFPKAGKYGISALFWLLGTILVLFSSSRILTRNYARITHNYGVNDIQK